jgi:hypothetical protein
MMREITADKNLVAYCGLYCGACKSYLRERCPGCHENAKATWCTIRTCCAEHGYQSCADCNEFKDPKQCAKFDNFVSRVFGLLFRSNRAACIECIRQKGLESFAGDMAARRAQSMPR